MTDALAFAETQGQLAELFRRRESQAGLTIVAATPEIDYYAERSHTAYTTVEAIVAERELVRQGDRNIDRTEELCDAFDRILHETASHVPHHEWLSARSQFHTLKGLLDSLTVRALPVIRAFETLAPAEAICFEQPPLDVSGSTLLDKPPFGLTTRLVPLVAAAHGIRVTMLPDPGGPDPGWSWEAPNGSTGQHPLWRLRGRVRRLVGRAPRHWPRATVPDAESPLLVHSLFSDLGTQVVAAWRHQHGRELHFSTLFPEHEVAAGRTELDDLGERLWHRVEDSVGVRRLFVEAGTDLFPLAAPVLKRLATLDVPECLAFAAVAERGMAKHPRAVYLTGGMVGRNYVLCKAASAAGAAVVSMHYGGYLGFSLLPNHERYDLAEADYFLCNGDGGAQTFAEPGERTRWRPGTKRAKPIALGSPWLDDLVRESRSAAAVDAVGTPRRRLMYVMSALLGDNRYLGYVFAPEIQYWRFQRRLVEAIAAFPDTTLVLKPPLRGRYPQLVNPIFEWLAAEGPANVEVLPDIPLKDVLHEADAFIIDSPSTPLLHVVATEKPLMVYCDRSVFLFQREAADLLRKRALFSQTEEEFFESLQAFLSEDAWRLERPVDDSFLHAYGTHVGDGRSADRCADFLHRIALGDRP